MRSAAFCSSATDRPHSAIIFVDSYKVGKSVEERKKQKIEIENWGNFYDQTDLDKFSSEFNDIAEEVYKTEETQPPTQGQFNRIVLCQIHFLIRRLSLKEFKKDNTCSTQMIYSSLYVNV